MTPILSQVLAERRTRRDLALTLTLLAIIEPKEPTDVRNSR